MPSAKFVVSSVIPRTFRAEKVKGMFDVEMSEVKKEFDVTIPIEGMNWNVGLILGASGTGKTTIAKRLFPEFMFFGGFDWKEGTLLDDFDKSLTPKQITEALSKVGFASPPDWLKPFAVLSNGQKMRAELARLILEADEPVIYDEFTSVVDRQVAKIGSAAIQKYIRKERKQFVAVSCHYDIAEWLEPDWIYDVNTHQFHRGGLRRPKIECEIVRVHHSTWGIFKAHHYMTGQINKSARCYVMLVNGVPAAFCAVISFPHPNLKGAYRAHRTVVLPDYQGIGLGNRLVEEVGEVLMGEGKVLISTTGHPAMISYRANSPKWITTRKPGFVGSPGRKGALRKTASSLRITASFRYVGEIDGSQSGTPRV